MTKMRLLHAIPFCGYVKLNVSSESTGPTGIYIPNAHILSAVIKKICIGTKRKEMYNVCFQTWWIYSPAPFKTDSWYV